MPPKRIITDNLRTARPSVTLCRLPNTGPTKVSSAAAKTGTHKAGFPISGQLAALHRDLLSAPKSLRPPRITNDPPWPLTFTASAQ